MVLVYCEAFTTNRETGAQCWMKGYQSLLVNRAYTRQKSEPRHTFLNTIHSAPQRSDQVLNSYILLVYTLGSLHLFVTYTYDADYSILVRPKPKTRDIVLHSRLFKSCALCVRKRYEPFLLAIVLNR